MYLTLSITKALLVVVGAMVSVAFMTLLERKLLSLTGVRLGPNKVSLAGLMQPIGDAVKLSNKSANYLINFSFAFYDLWGSLFLSSSLMLWLIVSSDPGTSVSSYNLIVFMILLGLNSLFAIIAGWSSFSKYSMLGVLRTISQLISYEGSLYLCVFHLVLLSYCFSTESCSGVLLVYPGMMIPYCLFIWVPSFLAELNRTPYDFSEGESELVSGFNVEFGSSIFTLLFLSEYSNIIFFCLLTSSLFFFSGAYLAFSYFLVFVIWIRSVLPRYRFDKLMMLAWKFFIPFLTLTFMMILFWSW